MKDHIARVYNCTVVVAAFVATSADAQGDVTHLPSPTPGVGTLFEFVVEVLKIVIKIGIPVVVVCLVLAGFWLLSAQGDTKKLADAKKALWWTVVGAAILLCAVLIATVVKNTIDALGG